MEPSEIINLARSVGADYLLMVKGMKPYNRAYKRHDVKSFGCLYMFEKGGWFNSCSTYQQVIYGLTVTNTEYEMVDLKNVDNIEDL